MENIYIYPSKEGKQHTWNSFHHGVEMLREEFQTNIHEMAFLHSDMELYALLWVESNIFLIDLTYKYKIKEHNQHNILM